MINIRKVANGYIVDPDRAYGVVDGGNSVRVFNKFSELVKYLKETLEKDNVRSR